MKKLLVVVIIVVIVALLAAYKCSRSRGGEEIQPAETEAPAAETAPAAEETPKAEEAAPAEEETAPAPAPAKEQPKKEVQKTKPAAEKVEKAEKAEPAAVKPAPKAQPAEKKPVEREEKPVTEKPVPGSPAPALNREPVSSNIDSAGVTKVINVSRAAIKRCYDKALMSNPQLKGKLSVKIVINQQGRVDSTEIVDDSLHDAEVSKCVRGVIGRLRFPKPAEGTATVTFPFAFDPKNQ